MNTKMMKFLAIIVIVAILISIFTSTVKALTPGDMENAIKSAQVSGDEITGLGGKVIKAIQIVGIVLSVGIIAVLGIKYMMGSVEEKSEYKKSMIPYLIGAACIFLATTIANVVYTMLTGN